MELQALKQKLIECLDQFCNDKAWLLENDVHEEAMSGELARYLYTHFEDLNLDINVDFNKRIIDDAVVKKKTDFLIAELHASKINGGEFLNDEYYRKEVLPDIILHKLENRDNNFLVFEVKKSTNKNKIDRAFDHRKLEVYTNPDLNYDFGVFLDFNTGADYSKEAPYVITFFAGGNQLI